jgi:DNA-binding NarL/FixJ family response regulator
VSVAFPNLEFDERLDDSGTAISQGGVMVSASFGYSGPSRFAWASRRGWDQRSGGFVSPLPAMSSSPFPDIGQVSSQKKSDSVVFSRVETSTAANFHSELIHKLTNGKQVVLLVDSVRLTRECLAPQLVECCPGLDLLTTESLLTSKLSRDADFPNIVILNMHGDGFSTPAVAAQVEYVRARSTPSIVIVDRIDAVEVEHAARRGLCGVFPSHGGVKLLAAAIHLVLAGGRFLPAESRSLSEALRREASEAVVESVGQGSVAKAAEEAAATKAVHELQNAASFTGRECEIIDCLRHGMQNKNIAFDLGISESTVKTHLRQIMQKLGAANRTEVVSLLYG